MRTAFMRLVVLLLFGGLLSAAAPSTEVEERADRLLLRQVGNAVLMSTGDRYTRVLPITIHYLQ